MAETMTAQGGDGPGNGGRGTPRWVKLLLAGSLALNLLVAGMVGGVALRGEHRAPVARDGGWPYVAALSPRERRALGREMRQALRAAGVTREARRGRIDEVLALLRSDPFPADRFEELLSGQFETASLVQEAGRRALLARVMAMGAEERTRYADRLSRAMRHGPNAGPGRR